MQVVAVLIAAFALFQVGKSDFSQVSLEISEALTECVTKQKLDKEAISSLINEPTIPEDGQNAEFFGCFATTLGAVDKDGNVVEGRSKEVLGAMLARRLGNIADVAGKVEKIIAVVFGKCKDTPKGDSIGQTTIKIVNCVKAEVRKLQTV